MARLIFFGMRLLSVVIVINGIAPCFSQTDCGEGGIEKCTNVLSTVIENPNIAFPENEADLDVSCRYFNQYVVCVHNFANRCYKAEGKDAFLSIFSGMLSLISDICTAGSPYRTNLLKHGPCFRRIESELQYCVDKFTAEGKALKTENISSEEKVKKSCCYLDASTECLVAPTMLQCGKEAVDLIKEASQKIYRPLTLLCSRIDYDSSLCSAASSLTISGILLVILMFITNLKR